MTLTLDLPDDVARRLAEKAPGGERERFVLRAIERALPRYSEDELGRIAQAVEADEELGAEMGAFDAAVADGVDEHL